MHNIPRRFTSLTLLAEIENSGFQGMCNGLHMPMAGAQRNKGVAFLSFTEPGIAWLFMSSFSGRRLNFCNSDYRLVSVVPAEGDFDASQWEGDATTDWAEGLFDDSSLSLSAPFAERHLRHHFTASVSDQRWMPRPRSDGNSKASKSSAAVPWEEWAATAVAVAERTEAMKQRKAMCVASGRGATANGASALPSASATGLSGPMRGRLPVAAAGVAAAGAGPSAAAGTVAVPKFCPHCGKAIHRSFRFCAHCGVDLSSMWSAGAQPPPT